MKPRLAREDRIKTPQDRTRALLLVVARGLNAATDAKCDAATRESALAEAEKAWNELAEAAGLEHVI